MEQLGSRGGSHRRAAVGSAIGAGTRDTASQRRISASFHPRQRREAVQPTAIESASKHRLCPIATTRREDKIALLAAAARLIVALALVAGVSCTESSPASSLGPIATKTATATTSKTTTTTTSCMRARLEMATSVEAAAAEWESLFEEGKMPYEEDPFPSIQEIMREHVPRQEKGVAVDVGAGSGRGSRWLARELRCSKVFSVEPTASGCETLAKIAGGFPPGTIEVVRDTALKWGWARARDMGADLVLFDSVLNFCPAEEQQAVVLEALSALRPDRGQQVQPRGGVLIVTSHPEEEESKKNWVIELVERAAGEGKLAVEFLEKNRVAPMEMVWEGEKFEAAFHVVVARVVGDAGASS